MDSVTIQTAHRTGKAIPAGRDMPPTRHIIFRLMNFEDKISILKGKREAEKGRFRQGKLFIDGKMYRPPHSDVVQSAEGSDMK